MPNENNYDLYITDQKRNIILEERSIAVTTAERIIRDYPWRDRLQSNAQFWKHHTKFSFSIHTESFCRHSDSDAPRNGGSLLLKRKKNP